MAKNNIQRALVLQGGGALGAYEAGVFKKLYQWIIDSNEVRQDENIFDIIAGTSIGAINAAFLVSYVTNKRKKVNNVRESWGGAAEKLEEFWKLNLTSNISLSRWWPILVTESHGLIHGMC